MSATAQGGTPPLTFALPEVSAVVKVPGGRMAHHFTTFGLHQHRPVPELLRHLLQVQRGEELLGHTEHARGVVALERRNKSQFRSITA